VEAGSGIEPLYEDLQVSIDDFPNLLEMSFSQHLKRARPQGP
jgi:hypothetical protein